ncbi:tetratricopeptide repeat protein 28-like [Stylophora pistillata]|uniref:tetratricopeptide repeat protein 28-like n=1 Tax=Stylophora pistillata TaxID=50429 RepID=UPI000C04922F|nr:tetratricopeptide repeat protein 28-like [Stylophora pistillata]XP_022790124.1 tetratricopeptide repeat protein 28-like [Stylophora pistillata]
MAEDGQVNVADGKSTDATEKRQVRSGDLKVNLADDIQADAIDVQAELPSDSTSQFDDDTLKAIAEVYLKEGDNEYTKGEADNAVHFYTEGLQVNCNNIQVNAALYSNRAVAQLLLGNYQEALDDATVSVQLEPTFIKAIESGASACVQLHFYQEAIDWCQKGLTIENNKRLLDLWTQCVNEQTDGTDESGSKQEVKTNLDKYSAKSEEEQINNELPQTAVQRVLLYAIEVGDKSLEGMCYCSLGNVYQSVGDFQRATQYHERHLKITKEVGDKAGERASYGSLAYAYYCLRDFEGAIQYLERHLKIAKEEGDKVGEGKSYGNLGIAYRCLGDFERAIQYHDQHLKAAKEVGDKAGEGQSYSNLGNCYHNLGDFERAIQYHESHLKIAKEVGDKAGEGASYCNLGNAYHSLGDFERAIQYHEHHLKIAKEVGDKAGEGKSYCNLGNANRCQGDFEKAIQYHKRHLKISEELGDKTAEGASHGNLGNAYHNLGDFERAIQHHKRHLNITNEVGDKVGEGKSNGNLGNAYQSVGDFERAIQYHERSLKIAKEVGNKAEEGKSYGNLGNAYHSLGDFERAIQYHARDLKIAKEVGDKAGEGASYNNLGNAYENIGDFERAIQYHERGLKIAKAVGNKAGEGKTYCNLGNDYQSLGDFERAIQYHELHLKFAKEVGDKAGKGKSYCNLGNAYQTLGDFQTAIQYHERHLKVAKEVGDKAGEGMSYCNLGNAYQGLEDFERAIQYHEHHLKIAKEVGDKAGEGKSYCNLGNSYCCLGDFERAIQYHEHDLKIAKAVGDKTEEGASYGHLGRDYWGLGDLEKAVNLYHSCIVIFEAIRASMRFKDDWKISYRNMKSNAYTCFWLVHLKKNQILDALLCAEQGRAQALNDLIRFNYWSEKAQVRPHTPTSFDFEILVGGAVNIVFMAVDDMERKIYYWFINRFQDIQLRSIEIIKYGLFKDVNTFIGSLLNTASREFKRGVIKCENRSLDEPRKEEFVKERSGHPDISSECSPQNAALRMLYDVIIEPIADLVDGNELIFVPESSLWLVPFAALMDSESSYLCDSFRVRTIPSLTTLKLINDYPDDFHNKTGALLVGDPCLGEDLFRELKRGPLPCARKEVAMIGRILGADPLIGEEAKKDEVLRRLPSVALVHFAAHGRMETGEIALAPRSTCSSQPFNEEDFILTMKEVLDIQIQARLVVLSCCHSAHGEIKAEGVVGIARAFMGAGARSVLVSLWAIDDEATLEFMKHFYEELLTGKLASEALNQAMKSMKESEKFSHVKYWAPFVLIGDDVRLEFD